MFGVSRRGNFRVFTIGMTVFAVLLGGFAAAGEPGQIAPEAAISRAVNDVQFVEGGAIIRHANHEARFDAQGLTFQPAQGGPEWQWRLVDIRRGDDTIGVAQRIAPKGIEAGTQAVQFRRGDIVEQYVPRTDSIEQQFVLEQRVAGSGDLIVDGAVTADAAFEASAGGWVWRNDTGAVRLGDVYVFDARGKTIPAQMDVTASRTRIRVDGAALDAAAYPVTIDPEIGGDFRITNMGPDTDTAYGAFTPDVAYNSTNNEFLVVWQADDDVTGADNAFEIFAQRIDAATGALQGTTSFQVSEMGTTTSTSNRADNFPKVAYNSTNNEYLVVWSGREIPTLGFEIYGQRIPGDLAMGDAVGNDDFRISDAGPDGSAIEGAFEPDVAYNSIDNQYLVVWRADDIPTTADNEFEVFGQLLEGDHTMGDEIGTDFRLSDMGPDGNSNYDAEFPRVAYNVVSNEYLVVWGGDDDGRGDNDFEIYGQYVDADGTEIGTDFLISNVGTAGSTTTAAFRPDVAYNWRNDEYLVVFEGDDAAGDTQFEILGRRVIGDSSIGGTVGADDIRLSDMGGNNSGFSGRDGGVKYNGAVNEYFVTWSGTDDTGMLVSGEREMYCQRVFGDLNDGDEIGGDTRLSDMGATDGNSAFDAEVGAAAYGVTNDQYLIVWQGDDDSDGADDEFEIYGQLFDQGNAPPALATTLNTPLDYDENDPATAIDPSATASDPDSADLNGGSLTVGFIGLSTANDQLSVLNAGGITVSGSTVSFSGNVIGMIDGTDDGVNGADLTINFTTTDATAAALQALMRAIAYENTSDDPNDLGRTVGYTATDGDGGTSFTAVQDIDITAFNDGPTVTLPGAALDYDEGDPATAIDGTATVTDPDSADLNGGALTVSLTMNGTADDQLSVLTAGGITIAGSTVSFSGDVIGMVDGTDNGVNGADLTINFTTTDATPAAVQALARAIGFANSSANPSGAAREATFTATDGDGGSSGGVTQTINVNPINSDPALTLPGAALDYDENDPATAIDATATVTDVDSPDFNGGSLTASLAINGTANDQLSVLSAGGITVAGSTVSFSGNAIGMVDGTDNGVNGADLTINFTTTDATPAAVQALARAIGFANSSDNPSTLSRTVAFTVTDGDTGSSGAINQMVNVNALNDAPSLILPSGSASYMEGGSPVLIEPAFILADPDSTDFDGGTLTADITMNNSDDDRLGIRNQGNGAGQVGVAGNVVSFGGTAVGTFAGGAKAIAALVVTFNANADAAAVQAVARNVTFSNVSPNNPSTAPRIVAFVVTDGDGGTSATSTKVVNVGALPLPLNPWPLAAVLLTAGLAMVAFRRYAGALRAR